MVYVPASLVVIVAFFVTNYLANDSWLPGYFHRERKTTESSESNSAESAEATQSAAPIESRG